jgi:RHS repeat-associated protein
VLDGEGRRVGKRRDGQLVERFLYGYGAGPVAELSADGSVRSRFIYGSRGHVPDYMIRDGHRYRLISDELGSVRKVIEADTGEVVQEMDFDPYGRTLRDTNAGFQPFGWAGGIRDADAGLIRFGARDYDPEAGRWNSKDPIGFSGGDTNLYGYVRATQSTSSTQAVSTGGAMRPSGPATRWATRSAPWLTLPTTTRHGRLSRSIGRLHGGCRGVRPSGGDFRRCRAAHHDVQCDFARRD